MILHLKCNKIARGIVIMDTTQQNSNAWDKKVEEGSRYTQPVSSEVIERSKSGEWEITVTTEKSVPRDWFPKSLDGLKILCLASGGGQQAPVLAAAGADVTVTDISRKQLEQDKKVAERDGLTLKQFKEICQTLVILKMNILILS